PEPRQDVVEVQQANSPAAKFVAPTVNPERDISHASWDFSCRSVPYNREPRLTGFSWALHWTMIFFPSSVVSRMSTPPSPLRPVHSTRCPCFLKNAATSCSKLRGCRLSHQKRCVFNQAA